MKNQPCAMLRISPAALGVFLLANPVWGQDFEGIVWNTPVADVAALHDPDVTVNRNGDFDGSYTYLGFGELRLPRHGRLVNVTPRMILLR